MATLTTAELKTKAEELVKKITDNKELLEKFKKDPTGTVKTLLQDKVSDDVVEKITDAVKAKINIDDAKGALNTLKGLFSKK